MRKPGFTIIELTIYIALMSVLILVISRIFISSLDIQLESESVSSVQQDGRFIIAKLAYDISQADSVTSPAGYGNSSSTLVLIKQGQVVEYTSDAGNLIYSAQGSQDRLNSTNVSVSDISFQRIGNSGGKDTVRVSFSLESLAETGSTGEEESFQTTIGTR